MKNSVIRNANFSGAKLGEADLLQAELTNADLPLAKVYEMHFRLRI